MNTQYEPLKVTAELTSPIILDRNMPLDGILGSVIIADPEFRQRDREYRRWRRAVRKYGEEDSRHYFATQGWAIPEWPAHFVPLDTWGHGQRHGLWVYCSSWAISAPEAPQGSTHFNKRLNVVQLTDWLKPKGRIQTGKGEFKSEHIPFLYTVTPTLTWYVRGFRAEIEEILAVAFSIGKKRAQGFGNVREWRVESITDDRSVFTPDGELMRPVPADLLEQLGIEGDFKYDFTTYRPPYWYGRWVARCAVSGKRL